MSLKRRGLLDLAACLISFGIGAMVVLIAWKAAPGTYTDIVRAMLGALVLLTLAVCALLLWVVVVASEQHRELAAVAVRAARTASRRRSDIGHAQVTAGAQQLAAAAHDLTAMLAQQPQQQDRVLDMLSGIAAALNLDIIRPVPVPGGQEHLNDPQ